MIFFIKLLGFIIPKCNMTPLYKGFEKVLFLTLLSSVGPPEIFDPFVNSPQILRHDILGIFSNKTVSTE